VCFEVVGGNRSLPLSGRPVVLGGGVRVRVHGWVPSGVRWDRHDTRGKVRTGKVWRVWSLDKAFLHLNSFELQWLPGFDQYRRNLALTVRGRLGSKPRNNRLYLRRRRGMPFTACSRNHETAPGRQWERRSESRTTTMRRSSAVDGFEYKANR